MRGVLAVLLCWIASAHAELVWHDTHMWPVVGQGFSAVKSRFDRLPAHAEKTVREAVWKLSEDSAGLALDFRTDSSEIHARWQLRTTRYAMRHMPASAVSGVDLYVKQDGRWRWLASGIPHEKPEQENALVKGLTRVARDYRLYLPLYNGVQRVSIGVLSEATLTPAKPEVEQPIVFYGTSIVQGAVASRAGMAYPAQIGRALMVPTINLGFSGECRMEPAMVALLVERAARAYVIDCLPNMHAGEVEARTVNLVNTLRKAHPETPIVLVEHLPYTDAFLRAERRALVTARNSALQAAWRLLDAAGVKKLIVIPAQDLIGLDGEGTTDGVHPSDLGMTRIAEKIGGALRAIDRDK